MENILEIKDLSVAYQETMGAVRSVTMCIPKGSIVSIVGESGSGKSTLIRSITGLLSGNGRITGGEILYHGENLVGCPKEKLRQIRGTGISMIFQNSAAAMDPKKKIGYQYREVLQENLKVSKKEADQMASDMLRKLSFPNPGRILDSYPFELSGGMLQRAAIAMSVLLKSDILLADEPTSALDVTIQAQVVKALIDLCKKQNTTIIMVTHNLGVASYMSDYIFVMRQGRVVEEGDRDSVIENPQHPYTKMLIQSVPDMEVACFDGE